MFNLRIVLKERDLEFELKGKALKLYLFMLRRGSSVGVTEIQRSLGFRNPSHVSYYLDKLIKLGLIVRDERGSYRVDKEVKVGVLRNFIKVGSLMLPRFLFYASLYTSMLVTYVLKFWSNLNPYVLVFASIGSLIFWLETIRMWLDKPY